MATFLNPNDPPQPQAGVYGWYAKMNERESICIYVGMAGKKNSIIPKGTLFRGVSEIQRNTFTSDSPQYRSLDTDFIVGTAIRYFEKNSFPVEWRHLSNDASEERLIAQKENPILQRWETCHIDRSFRLFKDEIGYWKKRKSLDGVREAEAEIFGLLERIMSEQGEGGQLRSLRSLRATS